MTDSARAALADGLARLTAAIHHYDRTINEHVGQVSWEDAALLLRLSREQTNLLGAAVGAVEAQVIVARAAEGIFEDTTVEGVGTIAVHRSRSRKAWDHRGLAGHVLDRHLTEQADGEIPPPWDVAGWLLDAAAVSYWRVTELKRLGIDADDFCTSEPGRRTVQIIHGDGPAREL